MNNSFEQLFGAFTDGALYEAFKGCQIENVRIAMEKKSIEIDAFFPLTVNYKIIEAAEKFFVNGMSYNSTNTGTLNVGEYQPVRYSLDTEGKIKRIFTVGNDFVQLAANSSRGFVANVFVQNQVMDIAVDSNTVFLQIPNNQLQPNFLHQNNSLLVQEYNLLQQKFLKVQ